MSKNKVLMVLSLCLCCLLHLSLISPFAVHEIHDRAPELVCDGSELERHKFYVSTTNIEYNSASQNLEMISRIFTDDLEAVLRQRYDPELKLNPENESEGQEELIKKYILRQWRIQNGDAVHELNYLGHQFDIDQVKLFIEVPLGMHPNRLFIENKTLFDLTSEQQNVIHVKVGDQRRSLLLFPENPNGVLNFD
ncbi:MAG: hypothetical protein EBY38_01530 [Flavobacteriaceae bacterium]|nr:hypothetical protein [Flavobacteriaceae bacterium]